MPLNNKNRTIVFILAALALLIVCSPVLQAQGDSVGTGEPSNRSMPIIENVEFIGGLAQSIAGDLPGDTQLDSNILLTLRNPEKESITVEKIYINNKSILNKNIPINAGSTEDIPLEYEWQEGSKYDIRAVTADGLNGAIVVFAPGVTRHPSMSALLIVSFLMFIFLIVVSSWKGGSSFDFEHGQMRSAIAGTLVFGFAILTFFSLYYPLGENSIYTQYVQLVGIIIGFYFGSRATASAGIAGVNAAVDVIKRTGKRESELEIEDAKFLLDTSKDASKDAVKASKAFIIVNNRMDYPVNIKRACINNKKADIEPGTETKIDPGRHRILTLRFAGDWIPGEIYNFEISADTGGSHSKSFVAITGGDAVALSTESLCNLKKLEEAQR